MGKEMASIHGSYKTWLCNAALFALICAAFAAGILLGPIVSSRGKNDLKEVRCSPDEASKRLGERGADSECISQKQLGQFMQQWSRAMNELIEEKMVNVSRRKINPAIRKLSRAKDAAMKKTIEGKVTFSFLSVFICLNVTSLTWNQQETKESMKYVLTRKANCSQLIQVLFFVRSVLLLCKFAVYVRFHWS